MSFIYLPNEEMIINIDEIEYISPRIFSNVDANETSSNLKVSFMADVMFKSGHKLKCHSTTVPEIKSLINRVQLKTEKE